MGDLILKPGSGGILRLKDQGGTEALRVNSGGAVVFSVSNPTITLGNNTTFGSGVDLSNATFPAGHIINFEQAKGTTAYTTSRDGWTPSGGTNPGTVDDAVVTITPSSSSNKIVLNLSGPYAGTTLTSLGISLYKNASDITETYNLPGTAYGLGLYANNHNDTYALNYCDTAGTINQITYKISFRTFNSSYSTGLGEANEPTVLLAYEIKV